MNDEIYSQFEPMILKLTRLVQTNSSRSIAQQAYHARREIETLVRVMEGGCDCVVWGMDGVCCNEVVEEEV